MPVIKLKNMNEYESQAHMPDIFLGHLEWPQIQAAGFLRFAQMQTVVLAG